MSFSYENLLLGEKSFFGEKRSVIENEILLPDYYPNLLRIMKIWARSFIKNRYTVGGKLIAEGSVETRILYLAEDGSLRTLFNQQPFSAEFDASNTSAESSVKIRTFIESAVGRSVSPRKVYVKVTPVTTVCVRENAKREMLSPSSAELEVKSASLDSYCFVGCGEKSTKVSDVFETSKDSPAEALLKAEGTVCVSEVSVVSSKTGMGGKASVKGDLFLSFLYLTPSGTTVCRTESIPVAQIIDIPDGEEGMLCDATLELKELSVLIKEDEGGAPTLISVEAEVFVSACCFDNVPAEIPTDAYSTKKQMNCTAKPMTFSRMEKVLSNRFKITESVDCEEMDRIIDAIDVRLDVKPSVEGGHLKLNGIAQVSLVGESADGEKTVKDRTIPFSVLSEALPDGAVFEDFYVIPLSVSHSAGGGKCEISVTAAYGGIVLTERELNAVTSVTEGEPYGKRGWPEMVVYYAEKGEKIFDIAKRYRTSERVLRKNNSVVGDEMKENGVLIVTEH